MISSGSAGNSVRVDISGTAIEKAEKLLAGIPDGMDKALKSAMSRSASSLRSNSVKEIRKVYAISSANVRAEQSIKNRYTYNAGSVTATVTFSGKKIPLYRYDGTRPKLPTVDKSRNVIVLINGHKKMAHPGISASGHQFASTAPEKFDDVFTAKMRSGHIGLFERTGEKTSGGSDRIEEIMGSSVPQMIDREEVREALVQGAYEKFEERMDHEVSALLNGWR